MKLSIVTPSLNQSRYLKRAAQSILSQSGNFDLEWLIIDGGSTDGTLEWLGQLTDPRVHWTSEPDRGQSHALNKGLSRAAGNVVAWLNSDDLYTRGALAIVADQFRSNPDAQWLIGQCEIIDAHGSVIRRGITRYKEHYLLRYRYRNLLRENFISQPAVFWRREFGQAIGPLDESLHWTMDYDLWLRMGVQSDPLVCNQVLAQFRLHEQSKSGRVDRRQFDEQYKVMCRYAGTDRMSRWMHRFNVEKIVLAYRAMHLANKFYRVPILV